LCNLYRYAQLSFSFMLLLLPFLSLYSLVLSTLHIYINKKRRTAIHNSIKLISIHWGRQYHMRLCSSSLFAYIYVDIYIYTIVLFSPFTVPLHMPIYGNIHRFFLVQKNRRHSQIYYRVYPNTVYKNDREKKRKNSSYYITLGLFHYKLAFSILHLHSNIINNIYYSF